MYHPKDFEKKFELIPPYDPAFRVFNRVLLWRRRKIKCFWHYHPIKVIIEDIGPTARKNFWSNFILSGWPDLSTCPEFLEKNCLFLEIGSSLKIERDVMTRKRTLKWKKREFCQFSFFVNLVWQEKNSDNPIHLGNTCSTLPLSHFAERNKFYPSKFWPFAVFRGKC